MIALGIIGITALSEEYLKAYNRQQDWGIAGIFDREPNQSSITARTHKTIAFQKTESLFHFSEAVILCDNSRELFALAKNALRSFQHIFICYPSVLTEDEMTSLLKISEESQVIVRLRTDLSIHPLAEKLLKQNVNTYLLELEHSFVFDDNALSLNELTDCIAADLSLLSCLCEGVVCKAEVSLPGAEKPYALSCFLKTNCGTEIKMTYHFKRAEPVHTITAHCPDSVITADFISGILSCGSRHTQVSTTALSLAENDISHFVHDINNHKTGISDNDIRMYYLAMIIVRKSGLPAKIKSLLQSASGYLL